VSAERLDDRPADDLRYPRQFAATRGFTCGQPRNVSVSPDGSRVVFLRSRAGDDPVLGLWVFDIATAKERCVFDPLEVPADEVALTPAERARRERVRERATGVVAYACDLATAAAVFVEGGRLMYAGLVAGGVREIPTPGVPDDPRLSPRGDVVAFVVEGDLWVTRIEAGEPRKLTGDADPDVSWGLAEFAAAEELGRARGHWWSPDGTHLIVARVDERPVQRWWISDPTDPAAEPVAVRYPRAGTANAIVTLHVIEVATGARVEVDWDEPDRFEYLTRVSWDEHALTLEVISRRFDGSRVLEVDATTGSTKVVATATSAFWVEPIAGLPARLGDGRLVTSDEVDGVRAVLVDGKPVSPPGFHLSEVLDTDGDAVWCTSSYGDASEDHVWVVGPGRQADRITTGRGLHTAAIGGGTVVVRSWLEDEQHARTVVRAGGAETTIANLAEAPVVEPSPRYLKLRGDLGLLGAVCVPGGVDPDAPLPVLVSSYGGPSVRMVDRWRGAWRDSQFFADRLGVAVLTIDGRGMLGHDLAWEHAIARDFGVTLDDQVTGLRSAADQLGYLDLDHVAFRGWSFGGMLAAMAVLRRPDVFHSAVSGAPVSDQRLYDTAYTDRFLGTPQDEPEAYRVSSPISFVDEGGPHRPLLLIHGLADDNVVAANTLQLSAALFTRGYHHELVLLPKASHMGGFDELVTAHYVAELDFLRRSLDLPEE